MGQPDLKIGAPSSDQCLVGRWGRPVFGNLHAQERNDQESIPIRYIPRTCKPYMLQWPPLDVSSGWGGVLK